MKAKEYLTMLLKLEQEKGFDPAVSDVVIAMSAEAAEITKARHCHFDSAVKAVISEMNDRWNAMAKKEPRLRRDGFTEFWERRLKVEVKTTPEDRANIQEETS